MLAVRQSGADISAILPPRVDMSVGNHSCVEDTSDASTGVALPFQLRPATIFRHFDTGRDTIETHHEHLPALDHRMANRHSEGRLDRNRPEHLTGPGIERFHPVTVPDQQLPATADGMNHGWAVAGLGGRQGSPDFLAGPLVKGHTGGAFTADHTDQPVAVDQWMGRRPPLGDLQTVVRLEITFPDPFPIGDGKTLQVPFGAQREDTRPVHGGSRSRTDGVDGDGRVGTRPLLLPDLLAGLLVQADDPLVTRQQFSQEIGVSRRVPLVQDLRPGQVNLLGLPIHHEHPPIGHGRPRVPASQRLRPPQRRSSFGKGLENLCFPPHRFPFRAKPLRPVGGNRD